jgi:hypothetical protein
MGLNGAEVPSPGNPPALLPWLCFKALPERAESGLAPFQGAPQCEDPNSQGVALG